MSESKAIAVSPNSNQMLLSIATITEMVEQRAIFKTFVKSQLTENTDFGVLPGTDKPSLWKPGAEKIANIFQLGSRIAKSERIFDQEKNFAMFAYTVEVFHIPSGHVIAQCEGICNSQEKKYKERAVYEWDERQRKKVRKGVEPTPICDVLNTLAKMSQKRAYVGAVIIATKASDFFNHDLNEEEEDFFEQNPTAQADAEAARLKELDKIRESKSQKEKAKFENKAHVDAEAKGAFDKFAGGAAVKQGPTERELLGKEMNTEYKRLKWNAVQFSSFVMENFGKTPAQLDIGELGLLVETLRRMQK